MDLELQGGEQQEVVPLIVAASSQLSSRSGLERKGSSEDNGADKTVKNNADDLESPSLTEKSSADGPSKTGDGGNEITSMGLKVLLMLAFQNCFKTLLARHILTDTPDFLYSAAVIETEAIKLVLAWFYILFIEKKSLPSSWKLLWTPHSIQNMKMLIVPASVYIVQQVLEYIALSNIEASIFTVLVQSKLIITALLSSCMLGTKLKKAHKLSLLCLTVGVVLCNYRPSIFMTSNGDTHTNMDNMASSIVMSQEEITGICATLGIALASGFAAVYTEKVIKKQKKVASGGGDTEEQFSLAFMQVQLAVVSLVVLGGAAILKDWEAIMELGLFHNFTGQTHFLVLNSALGGLLVAAVLKYASSVLKGYATALSVIMVGTLSWALFDTSLNPVYVLGSAMVVFSIYLFNSARKA
jgi:UDP-sugar transporter A1/2/3